MAEFYKMEIGAWNTGTDLLTLEQEAAFLRVVNAIRLYEQPLTENPRVLAGLWRCNERKAKRLLAELVEAGKLRVEDGRIVNERAVNEASNLRQLRIDAQSTGRRGGIESGKSRRNSLKNNDQDEGDPSTREEKSREEKRREEEESAAQPLRDAAPPEDSNPENPDPPDAPGGDVKPEDPVKPEEPTRRERLLAAMGADPVSGVCGPNGVVLGRERDMVEADRWEKLGIPLESQCRLISERVSQARVKQPNFLPRTFGYFTPAMEDLAAAKDRPASSPRTGSGYSPTDEQLRARWARAGT